MNHVQQRISALLKQGNFPQRVLLSGADIDYALEIAAHLQQKTIGEVTSGSDSDTIVFRDNGKSFKIDYSDAARRDEQGEYENVRGIIRWIARKPIMSPRRVIVLEHIERITRDAPHALLKIIEEPPEYGTFLFTTRNHHQMLPTILSRMVVFGVGTRQHLVSNISDSVVQFLGEWDLFEAFGFFDALTKKADKTSSARDQAVEWMLELLEYVRQQPVYNRLLPIVLETYEDLNANLNVRFTLERMALRVFEVLKSR